MRAVDPHPGLQAMEALRQARRYEELIAQAAQLLTIPAELTVIERGTTLLLTARAEMALQRLGAAQEHLTQAAELFTEAGADERACEAQLFLARTMLIAGSLRQTEHQAEQSLQEALAQGWGPAAAYARLLLGMVWTREHRYHEALPLLTDAHRYYGAPAADAGPSHAEFAHDSANALAWALAGAGRVAEGMALAEEELARFEAEEADPTELAVQLNALIFAAWCAGDFARMRPLQQRMLELEQRLQRPMPLMTLYYNMAIAETQLGGFHSAKRHLHRSWDIARRTGDTRLLPPLLMLLSLLALHDNQPLLAREYGELASSNLREFGTDESALLSWYLALAYLGGGELTLAHREWASRVPLEPSIENWLELAWLRRALAHIASPAYAPRPPLAAEGRAVAHAWEDELTALLAHYPAPAALAQSAA